MKWPLTLLTYFASLALMFVTSMASYLLLVLAEFIPEVLAYSLGALIGIGWWIALVFVPFYLARLVYRAMTKKAEDGLAK